MPTNVSRGHYVQVIEGQYDGQYGNQVAGTRHTGSSVEVDGDLVLIDRLVVDDPVGASALRDRGPADRVALAQRALRIGLLALADANVAVNVDVVRREFESLLSRTQQTNERAQVVLESALRAAFGEAGGQLPTTLEKFVGDKGQLAGAIREPALRSNERERRGRQAPERARRYFDGDASRLAHVLDTSRPGGPLFAFRQQMEKDLSQIADRLTFMEGAKGERRLGTAKGGDFEDTIEAMLAGITGGSKDDLVRTGNLTGAVPGSKKGDFVITLNRAVIRNADLRTPRVGVASCARRSTRWRASKFQRDSSADGPHFRSLSSRIRRTFFAW